MATPLLRDRSFTHVCRACGRSVASFAPGPGGRPDARCPRCHALERQRLLGVVLDDVLAALPPYRRLVDVDDQSLVRRRRLSTRAPEYVSLAPLASGRPDLIGDPSRLPFEDSFFEVAVVADSLLRVPDDHVALQELRRVLHPAGVLVLMVAIASDAPTDEDPTAAIMDRLRRFGAADRLRHYGNDLAQRLEDAGFVARRVASSEYLDPGERERFGIPAGVSAWLALPMAAAAAVEPTAPVADLLAHVAERQRPPSWRNRLRASLRLAATARAQARRRLRGVKLRSPTPASAPTRGAQASAQGAPPASLPGPALHVGHAPRRSAPRPAPTPTAPLDRPPLWIVGAPRSGTTYLVEVLSRHPGIRITNETRVFTFLNRLLVSWGHAEFVLGQHRRDFLAHMRRSIPALVEGFYAELGARPGMRWGDKFPHYADGKSDPDCLDLIEASFPDGQYLNIIRDGREVVSSIVDKDFAPLDEAIDVWQRHVRHAAAFATKVPKERFLDVRYEELVSDGEAVVRRILAFLDVPADPTVLAFVRQQARARTPFSKTQRNDAAIGQPLWRSRLGDDADRVEAELSDLLRELGYLPTPGTPGTPATTPQGTPG